MSVMMGPPPPGGDLNRASEVYAFTWILEIISIIFVAGRMYSRVKLTRNAWWDDWCVCLALALDVVVSVIWSVYAGKGYARHLYYLTPIQIADAGKLNFVSRSLCILSIGIGKVSVAFLIERIAPPGSWRKWMLRTISISIILSALITVMLFYVQCRPARALWDQRLIKSGIGKCWNPIPVNTWDLVIASYWAFLDFALALIPIDIIWKLQMNKSKRFLISLLLSMGIFAGICAAVKTSKIPITVKAKTDITWDTIELLMWNGIEMNVIIIAACIPTLRPLYLLCFNRPGASHYRPSLGHQHSYYQKTADSTNSSSNQSGRRAAHTDGIAGGKCRDPGMQAPAAAGKRGVHGRDRHNSIVVDQAVLVDSVEIRNWDYDIEEREREWDRSGVAAQGVGET